MYRVVQAQEQDLDSVLALARAKTFAPSHIPQIDPARRQSFLIEELHQYWHILTTSPKFSTLLAYSGDHPMAFWLTSHGQADFSSGQPESILLEHTGESKAYPLLLEWTQRQCRAQGDEFLAVRLYPEEKDIAETFRTCGFAAEFHRVVRALTLPPKQVTGTIYKMREATSRDRVFMARLHLQSSPFYRSAGRNGLQESSWGNLGNYLSLQLGGDLLGWMACENDEPIGYVLIQRRFPVELYPREAGYLYDVSVLPDHWGRQAASQLHEHAMAEAAARQIGLIVGDISADNPRALKVASKLGYQPEWERWGQNL